MIDVNTLLDEQNGFLDGGSLRIQASVTRLKGDPGGATKGVESALAVFFRVRSG